MGQFNICITAIGPNGCDRKTLPGGKLYGRCGKLTCPDCLMFDFVQMLRMKGMTVGIAKLTHYPGTAREVVDDVLVNERKSGDFWKETENG